MVEEFGADVLAADGTLDRPALGAVVFADPDRRAALNAIVHPWSAPAPPSWSGRRVRTPSSSMTYRCWPRTDSPLLRPGRRRGRVPETQLDRLVNVRGMTESDARARMAAQATREERLAVADLTVDNDGPLEALEPQVRGVWEELLRRAAATG